MKIEKNQGFTLLELMIVVAILGVIAAIAIPAYKGYISTGHETECQNEVASIKLAESEYFLENNLYFLGGDVATLTSNSGGIYKPSKNATATNSQCDYAVTSTDNGKTNYTVTATGASGGNLINNKTYVSFTGP